VLVDEVGAGGFELLDQFDVAGVLPPVEELEQRERGRRRQAVRAGDLFGLLVIVDPPHRGQGCRPVAPVALDAVLSGERRAASRLQLALPRWIGWWLQLIEAGEDPVAAPLRSGVELETGAPIGAQQ